MAVGARCGRYPYPGVCGTARSALNATWKHAETIKHVQYPAT